MANRYLVNPTNAVTLDVTSTGFWSTSDGGSSGAIKLNFPHLEIWEMAETCALDVADRGGVTLAEAGKILNLTRERIRQVETLGLRRLASNEKLSSDGENLPKDRKAGK